MRTTIATLRVALLSTLFGLSWNATAQSEVDVQWCLTGDATYTILQQPMRDYCPWVAAGSAVGVWFAPQYATYVMTKTQKGWSQDAATLSCSLDAASQSAAIGLIAACQCHNQAAADWVIANPSRVLAVLRKHAGCGG